MSSFISLLCVSLGDRQIDGQRHWTSTGNRPETNLLLQMTKQRFLFHPPATQTSNVSGGELGEEKVKYTTAFWFGFSKSLFLTIRFQRKVLHFPLHLEKVSSSPPELKSRLQSPAPSLSLHWFPWSSWCVLLDPSHRPSRDKVKLSFCLLGPGLLHCFLSLNRRLLTAHLFPCLRAVI